MSCAKHDVKVAANLARYLGLKPADEGAGGIYGRLKIFGKSEPCPNLIVKLKGFRINKTPFALSIAEAMFSNLLSIT